MDMRVRNQRLDHSRMRRAGARRSLYHYITLAGVVTLALMMLTLPIAAASEFPLTSGVDPSGPVHGGGYAVSAESDPFALTSGVDPSGPVHGGGYAVSAESDPFALTSGVDPSGPVHGGGYAVSAESDPFALTSGVDPSGPVHGGGYAAPADFVCPEQDKVC